MAQLHSDVLDSGLVTLTGATNVVLHICSAEPTTRALAISLSLGNKTSPTISSPQAGVGGGRQVTISEITDGDGTAAGTATHWAIIDGTRLLAAQSLYASVEVTADGTFYLSEFTIRIPGPA